jgi:hypothetical protein
MRQGNATDLRTARDATGVSGDLIRNFWFVREGRHPLLVQSWQVSELAGWLADWRNSRLLIWPYCVRAEKEKEQPRVLRLRSGQAFDFAQSRLSTSLRFAQDDSSVAQDDSSVEVQSFRGGSVAMGKVGPGALRLPEP